MIINPCTIYDKSVSLSQNDYKPISIFQVL